ncbi:hypothetical protein RJ641_019244 [Dillenia turbinata]|uniref:Uncharacterized protein n=1 Tax=Dillenia turbinata TaxID=194707 RepID=A0AAN8Z0L6_9MAGN
MEIWSWICNLPGSEDWSESNPPLTLQLASSPTQSIHLKAERTSGSNAEALVTFSICIEGFFNTSNDQKTLWVSDACPLSSDKPFLPLVLQLLQEVILRAPNGNVSTCPRSQLRKLKPEPVSWVLDSHSPESFSGFFDFVFLMRLFWLCVCDAPSEVGSLYFHSLLGPNIEGLSWKHAPVLRTFFVSVGVDVELCLVRSLGYMLAKWLILREANGAGLGQLVPLPTLGFCYAGETHGFWTLKGYAPVMSMNCTRVDKKRSLYPIVEAKESALRYALAHQQLEAVVQLEYSVEFCEGFIRVSAGVDNLRFHVAKLGFNKNEEDPYANERHFPSRIRVWVGPEVGATYVAHMSLGRSTDNVEKEIETQKMVKGNFEKSKLPRVKSTSRTSTRTKVKNWRWDQDVEGNAAIFEAILCDNMTGAETATWNPSIGDSRKPGLGFQKRYTGVNRPFSKNGSIVFARDEYGESVVWRLSKEMEGSVLKWRIGGRVWLSYWPCDVKSCYFETRCVEWCDEVDLPLIPNK